MNSPLLEAQGLGVRFGDFQALSEVNFQLDGPSFLAIIGANGSGKSTLLKLVLGLIPPSEGTIRLFNGPPAEASPAWIGYVPQVKTLDRSFPALALELVVNGIRRSWPWRISADERRRGMEALERVGAGHLAQRPVGRLSGGELQRVYLARGLVRQPRILLLDEPASGVDAVGEADMYALIDNLFISHQTTVLMVTHDMEAAFHHATHALVLSRRQIAFGPPDEALSEAALRRAFGHVDHAHCMTGRAGEHHSHV